jgi:hypothetical protein
MTEDNGQRETEDIPESSDSDSGDFVANRCGRAPQREQAKRSRLSFGLRSIVATVTRRRTVSA